MKQDNALFRQLLTLHDSISALKITPAYPHRPSSPASLDSFTEEEEDEDDDDEEEEDDQMVVGVVQKTSGREDNLSDVDEGLEIDHSTSHSNSPTSTLSSNSSRDSQFSRYSSEVRIIYNHSALHPSQGIRMCGMY
ncbi:probable serine/threonine-protein kinase DDB_G0290621 [Cherax quadricarinatus]